MGDVVIRLMTTRDAGFYCELVDMVGWGLSAGDFSRMLAYEPEGCFVASVDGEDVGMVASFLYGEVGWIGNLITVPEHRGRGVGEALMRRAIDRITSAGAGSIRLDAVPRAVPLYTRLGFRPEYRSLRFTGVGRVHTAVGAERMRADDLTDVLELDSRSFGASRERMLRRILGDFGDLCFVARGLGRIVGYIMAKRGPGIVRIGPWICEAGEDEAAEDLLHAAMSQSSGMRLWVGVPEDNQASMRILRSNGFEEMPSSLRMCLGSCAKTEKKDNIFGIGAAEKG